MSDDGIEPEHFRARFWTRFRLRRHEPRPTTVVREEAVVSRTDSNPSRHEGHGPDHLARLHARAGLWWMPPDYLPGPTGKKVGVRNSWCTSCQDPSTKRSKMWPTGSIITRTHCCGCHSACRAPSDSAKIDAASRSSTRMSRWACICGASVTPGHVGAR